VPAAFGRSRPGDLTTDLEHGRLDRQTLRERLPPIVFAAADGDPVAARLVADVADEIVAWAGAMIRRLHLTRTDVPVVLSGGIIRTTYAPFHDRIRLGIAAVAPAATVRPLTVPPVVGAALLGLDRLGLAPAELATAEVRLRTELTFARLGVGPA
jgi:N-acetylglucosamine kinase-like BadF-type ATPase